MIMKVSKSELKELIKECLIEILADGLGPSLNEGFTGRSNSKNSNYYNPSRRSVPKQVSRQRQQSRDSLEPQLRAAVNEVSKGNPGLAAILEDTANTTMREQSRAGFDDMGGGSRHLDGIEGAIVDQHTPEEIFGAESTAKWAELAFMK